eukprot:CAMPEP_0204437504 /NCGR_PEP_ID=MMETSP0470-20130426/77518_1 /ASSEMBLY_ACC=CAM_ASM_000385 /TAXON_ID=2969 /ORGANISM="Oxyrrhis marina" /LENGTH=65 /DNA_ID=CAMNT_0051436237 /DNA_START=56 /DNA_END=253 /DNA_ORIENTATION=+
MIAQAVYPSNDKISTEIQKRSRTSNSSGLSRAARDGRKLAGRNTIDLHKSVTSNVAVGNIPGQGM